MRFKNFEIGKCSFVGDPPTPDYHKWNFALLKWDKYNGDDNEYCFVIGHLEWNRKEFCFDFKSCGTRYLQFREDGLEEWLLKWCELKEIEYEHMDE